MFFNKKIVCCYQQKKNSMSNLFHVITWFDGTKQKRLFQRRSYLTKNKKDALI